MIPQVQSVFMPHLLQKFSSKTTMLLCQCSISVFFIVNSPVYAQTALDQQLRQQERIERDFQETTEDLKPKSNDFFFQLEDQPDQQDHVKDADAPCLPIAEVTLVEDHYLGIAPPFLSESEGQCLGVADIKILVNRLNKFYQAQGFITTRAYVPQQNLASGLLEIRIRPGIVTEFAYGDGTAGDNRLYFAFPISEGDIVYLRDLEQGLENFNALSSQSGKFKLKPGKKPGDSIIVVEEQQKLPIKSAVTYQNSGSKSRGQHSLNADLRLENMFNINDQLLLSHNRMLPYEHIGKSGGYFVQASVPFGYWQAHAHFLYNSYEVPLTSLATPLDLSGYGLGYQASLKRTLWRGQATKVKAHIALNGSRSRSFVEDIELITQRRYYTSYDVGTEVTHLIDKTRLEANISYRQGVHWLGSQKPVGHAFDPQFRLFKAEISAETPLFQNALSLRTKLQGQWTKAKLPSGEKFYIGGHSSVRGFREEYLTGRQGLIWKTDVTVPLSQRNWGSVSGKVGFDFGLVDPPKGDIHSDNKLAGMTAGIQVNLNDMLTLEAAYERPLYRPDQFQESPDIFYLNARFGLATTAENIVNLLTGTTK